eukprot:TRINITY_DN3500_c0_g1_i3.p1 TRINITY_DN3500_c0_g1~~TRINITY_DN3500_c0_g1_i3.p1  ORF type:complete len:104 (-),score=25.47 TRINITY_DN3500_c0_g1_i3:175-486(-)
MIRVLKYGRPLLQAQPAAHFSAMDFIKKYKYLLPFPPIFVLGLWMSKFIEEMSVESPVIAIGAVAFAGAYVWSAKHKVVLPEDSHYTVWTVNKEKAKKEKIIT